jgi:hypothetical protein
MESLYYFLVVQALFNTIPKGTFKEKHTMSNHTTQTQLFDALPVLPKASFEATDFQRALNAGVKSFFDDEDGQSNQIGLRTLEGEADAMDDHIEWNVASVKSMQIALVTDGAELLSRPTARPDNIEDIFAWVFDTSNQDAFGIAACAAALNQTTFDLQRRYFRRLKKTMLSLPKSCKQEKRDFYERLKRKVRIELAKNADYVVCTEIEAQIALEESQYQPH